MINMCTTVQPVFFSCVQLGCKGPKIDGVCPGQGEMVVTILGDSFGARILVAREVDRKCHKCPKEQTPQPEVIWPRRYAEISLRCAPMPIWACH